MGHSTKMMILPMLIAVLAIQAVKSDWNYDRRGGQWVQRRNPSDQNGNQLTQGGNSDVRVAICRFYDRCPNAGEVNAYASSYNGRMNELVRVLADSGDFESNFITNKGDNCQTLYRKLLQRDVDTDGQYLCSKAIPVLGYRWVKNQLIDSPEYQQKFGVTAVPGRDQCRRDCSY